MIDAPAELTQRPQWVAWRFEQRKNEPKPTKVPVNARTGQLASTTDPSTWSTYLEALAYLETGHADGIGYVLSADDPYVGLDLDACRNVDTGVVEPWALSIVRRMKSYTEISPSQTGLRIFILGTLPPFGRRKGHIEVYAQKRFLTITGWRYLGAPGAIYNRQDELVRWHAEVFGERAAPVPVAPSVPREPNALADAELLDKAQHASNGATFWALWNGDWSAYHSQSEADLALCDFLAFWTGPDPGRIDLLFRLSGLWREKWERDDYRTATISKALDGRTEFYDPRYRSNGNGFAIGAHVGATPVAPPSSDYPIVQVSLVETDEQSTEPLVQGFKWRKRVHWTFAGAGTGKTLWELGLGVHIAAGLPFLGRPVIQGPVLIIEEDSPIDTAQEYVRMLCEIYHIDFANVPLYINSTQGLRLRDEAGIARARAAIDACPETPIAVIFDAAERLVPSRDFSSSELDPFDRLLKSLINDNIVPTVIDHINRRGRQDTSSKAKGKQTKPPPLDLLYGGQSKHAMCDIMLFMEGSFRRGNPVEVTWEKFRVAGAAPPNFAVWFNEDDGFRLTEHRVEPATESQRKVFRFLQEHIGWHSRDDLAAGSGLGEWSLRRALTALVTGRWIEVDGQTNQRRWRCLDTPVHLGS